jgi:hypothetical protein
MISKAAFCSKVLTAKEVINMAVRFLPYWARHQLGAQAGEHGAATAKPCQPGKRGETGEQVKGIAADHNQLAVRKVDQLQDAVNDDQPQRQHGIQAAQADGVDDEFQI